MVNLYLFKLYVYILTSSPFLFVFGDDRVTCHMGADNVSSDAGDA